MADEIIVETTSTEVIEVSSPGPQGPAGAAGSGLETLTQKGDTLYRGETTGERLPIGTTGQILRVSASGVPEWGAAPASGVSSVSGKTGAVSLDSTDIFTDQALQISDAGIADCNAVFVYGGLFNGRATYYATKDTFVYWDGSNWIINHNGNDQYFGTPTTYPWQAVWSLGDGANPLPVVTQAASHEFEQVVGQRTNPTSRGDAASKNVGTGANDVAAGNHSHSAATQSVAGFLSAADKTKLDGIAAGAEINVNADWTASSGDAQILNKPSTFAPSLHSSSHATGGSDPLAPSDIGAQSIFVTEDLGTVTANVTLTAARAKIYTLNTTTSGLRILLPASDVLAGDIVQINFISSTGQSITPVRGSMTGFFTDNIGPVGGPVTFIAASASGTSWTIAPVDRHVHGNIGDQGNIGITSGLPVKTGAGGVLEVGAFGTSAGQFAEGNHTHAQLHDRSHAITSTSDHTAGNHKVFYSDGSGQVQELALGSSGTVLTSNGATSAPSFAAASGGVSAVNSTLADILSVSGSDLVADDLGADKLYGFDDSEGKAIGFTIGSGLSVSGDTLSATASGGSKTYAVFTAEHNQPPSTAFATLDTRNSIAVLDFDAATDENAVFVGIMPEAASLGSGLIVRLHWMATTATSGNVRWGVQFERSNTDLDTDSFAAAVEANGAANGTSGILTTTAITVTDFDGITAGDVFRLKVFRNADDATNDTMTGDAELVAVEVRSAA